MADDKMEISIKGVVFRGSAKQFERSIGQIVQMVAGQNVGAVPPPNPTLPQLPPATPAPQTSLTMRVETDTSMREEDERRFDAHQHQYWREQDYRTPPRSLPYASPLELVPPRSPAPEPQATVPDTTNQLLELRQLLELIAFNNQTLVTPTTEVAPTEPKQQPTEHQAIHQTIDLEALVRNPMPTATDQILKLRRRRRLQKKALLWLAEAIASLSLAIGAYFFFQSVKNQETVPTPTLSPSPGKPAPIASPKARSQPHH